MLASTSTSARPSHVHDALVPKLKKPRQPVSGCVKHHSKCTPSMCPANTELEVAPNELRSITAVAAEATALHGNASSHCDHSAARIGSSSSCGMTFSAGGAVRPQIRRAVLRHVHVRYSIKCTLYTHTQKLFISLCKIQGDSFYFGYSSLTLSHTPPRVIHHEQDNHSGARLYIRSRGHPTAHRTTHDTTWYHAHAETSTLKSICAARPGRTLCGKGLLTLLVSCGLAPGVATSLRLHACSDGSLPLIVETG
jgi:hypothetical protein